LIEKHGVSNEKYFPVYISIYKICIKPEIEKVVPYMQGTTVMHKTLPAQSLNLAQLPIVTS